MTDPTEHDTFTELLLELVDVEVLIKAVQSVPDTSDVDALRDALIGCLPNAVDLSADLIHGAADCPRCARAE